MIASKLDFQGIATRERVRFPINDMSDDHICTDVQAQHIVIVIIMCANSS